MAPLTSPHPTEISTDAPTEEPLAPGDVYYVGRRTSLGQAVLVEHDDDDERPLPISDGGRGYSWGTAGSKPVELARGILFDATADEQLAAQLCKAFTWEVIGLLPADFFRLGRSEVLAWLEDYRFDFPVPAGLRSRRLDGATTRTGRVVQQRPRPGTMRAAGSKVAVKLDRESHTAGRCKRAIHRIARIDPGRGADEAGSARPIRRSSSAAPVALKEASVRLGLPAFAWPIAVGSLPKSSRWARRY